MRPGDLVLCRVNAPLIPVAYSLIHRGIKPVIRGRKIGEGLIDLLEKLLQRQSGDDTEVSEVRQELALYRFEQEEKLMQLGDKALGRLGALKEKCDCLAEFLSYSENVVDCRAAINDLFKDFEADGKPKNAVVLGTIHRTKGLESERVFVLNPELIPHPMAKKDWEQQGEYNCAYIAVTRAKYDSKTGAGGTLIFCGPIPEILQGGVTENMETLR
jgi:superfamily I DNA/RNA helicase